MMGKNLPMLSYDTLNEAAIYALNHLHALIWNIASKQHPIRNAIQWIADVTCLFEGFDHNKQGYITLEEFLLGLKLLNISVAWDILMNIPYVGYASSSPYVSNELSNTPTNPSNPSNPGNTVSNSAGLRQGNSLVQYKKILAYVLQKKPPFGMSHKHHTHHSHSRYDAEDLDDEEYDQLFQDLKELSEDEDYDQDDEESRYRRDRREKSSPSKRTSTTTSSNKSTSSKKPSLSPTISQFYHVLRKQLSIFILSQSSLEEVWYTVTQIFQQYDIHHTGYVTPRQFCLALGILLGEEEIIFTAVEWQEILEYFLALSRKMEHNQQQYDSVEKKAG